MKNIFVGNLDSEATEQSLRLLFEPHGTVESVSVMLDRVTGQPRGFAFIEMTEAGEASRAITALNGAVCGRRALNVSEARANVASVSRDTRAHRL